MTLTRQTIFDMHCDFDHGHGGPVASIELDRIMKTLFVVRTSVRSVWVLERAKPNAFNEQWFSSRGSVMIPDNP